MVLGTRLLESALRDLLGRDPPGTPSAHRLGR
jgi:hypothetical protein